MSSSARRSKEFTCPDGVKVFAEAIGDPTKHPVIFIHGLASCGAGFDKQFSDPRLAQNYYLIRYDLRGHGRSEYPPQFEAYQSIRYAEEFKTVCDGFGVVKPSVVAWSAGACIVVDVVEAYGISYLSNIIYCGGPIFIRHIHDQYIHPHVLTLVPGLMSTDAQVIALTAPKYADSLFHDMKKNLSYSEQQRFVEVYTLQPPIARTHTLLRTQKSQRFEKEIKEKEVLVIQGRHDRHSRADALLEAAKRYLGKFETRMVERAGHAPHFEKADEVNGYILAFLQRKLRE